MTFLTSEQIDKQESLTIDRLKNISQITFPPILFENRPKQNLTDLFDWVRDNTSHLFGGPVTTWIHNKIVIDGAFLQFAEENSIKIESLYRDSVASWKSEFDNESFMAQGVFLLTKGDMSFVHAALFHKGNQFEDEVSFFNIVKNDDYNDYISLRNSFENWLDKRDRDNLEIAVVGGNSIPYAKDSSWEDLFLPEKTKEDIKNCVEGFLAAKEIYAKKKIPWKRGMLFYGHPGGGKTTCIKTIISNYDFKPVTVQSSSSTNDEVVAEAFDYAQVQGPSLLYFEDLDTLLSTSVTLSHFLNLMDGVSAKTGILVVATANDPDLLGEAIFDRPSRFDRKIEFPLPDSKLARIYLKKWFEDDKLVSIIIKKIKGIKFSYAYLKEIYLTSVYHALSCGREEPDKDDVLKAIEQLIYDKEQTQNGFGDENEYDKIGITT